jgi:hypothetical protein
MGNTMGNTMGNLNSSQDITMSNICTQLNILHHKINYCLAQIDTLKYKVQDLETNVNNYDPEDYNDVFPDDSENENENENESSQEPPPLNSYINEFTWDYYEIDQTTINNIQIDN